MEQTPRKAVHVGIRNEWLIAAGVREYARTDGDMDVLDWLDGVNAGLPCPALPSGEVARMVPGVAKWGAWLRRSRKLRVVGAEKDHSPEAQRRRGVLRGRQRQRAARRRQEKVQALHEQGHTGRQIAATLGTSLRTVRNDLAAIRQAREGEARLAAVVV